MKRSLASERSITCHFHFHYASNHSCTWIDVSMSRTETESPTTLIQYEVHHS